MNLIFKLLSATLLACAAIGASAAPQPPLIVFGDSLSDSGNNSLVFGNDTAQIISSNFYIPGQTYASGTYSNGPVWATQFASQNGFAPLVASLVPGGTNYAHGGAVTGFDIPIGGFSLPSLKTQVSSYLSAVGNVAPANGLFVVAGGGNDARNGLEAVVVGGNDLALTTQFVVDQYVANVGFMVDALQAAGAQNIIVWNTPNIGLTPAVLGLPAFLDASAKGTSIANSMNSALATRLATETGVQTFDIFGIIALAAADPVAFTNITDACGNVAKLCNGDLAHALFFDGIHPTTAGHALIANQMKLLVTPVPEPSELAMVLVGLLVVVRVARRKLA